VVGRPPGFAPGVRGSSPRTGDRRHGLGRAHPSRAETRSDKSAGRRHPERLRHAGVPRAGNRLGTGGGRHGPRDTPRIPPRDRPLRPQGSAGVRTTGLRIVSTAPTATAGLAGGDRIHPFRPSRTPGAGGRQERGSTLAQLPAAESARRALRPGAIIWHPFPADPAAAFKEGIQVRRMRITGIREQSRAAVPERGEQDARELRASGERGSPAQDPGGSSGNSASPLGARATSPKPSTPRRFTVQGA
jgi:hypothetical protein